MKRNRMNFICVMIAVCLLIQGCYGDKTESRTKRQAAGSLPARGDQPVPGGFGPPSRGSQPVPGGFNGGMFGGFNGFNGGFPGGGRMDPTNSMWNIYSNQNLFPQGGNPFLDQICSQYTQFGGSSGFGGAATATQVSGGPAGRVNPDGVEMVLPPDVSRTQCIPTDDDQLGPFYEPGAPRKNTICTQDPQFNNEKLTVQGYVLSSDCRSPIANAKIEIWQASYTDAQYHDYCRGTIYTDNEGYYYFTTVHPGTYTSRPVQHIHYRVTLPGTQFVGVYQMYFNTDQNRALAGSPRSVATVTQRTDRETAVFNFIVNPNEPNSQNTAPMGAMEVQMATMPPQPGTPQCIVTPADIVSQTPPTGAVPMSNEICKEKNANNPASAVETPTVVVQGYVYYEGCGTPVPNARVKLWVTNSLGQYTTVCSGYMLTDRNGAYEVQTPTPRDRRLSVQVEVPQTSADQWIWNTVLQTSFYFDNGPQNIIRSTLRPRRQMGPPGAGGFRPNGVPSPFPSFATPSARLAEQRMFPPPPPFTPFPGPGMPRQFGPTIPGTFAAGSETVYTANIILRGSGPSTGTPTTETGSRPQLTCNNGILTPQDQLGPYYLRDQTQKPNYCAQDSGFQTSRLRVEGYVVNSLDCRGLSGAKVELWSASSDGDYYDMCRGYVITDNEGYYSFTTVLPGYYNIPRRPRHIHMRVTLNGTTFDRQGTAQDFIGVYQMYFEGDPRVNEEVAANPALRQLTIQTNPPLHVDTVERTAVFNIVINPTTQGADNFNRFVPPYEMSRENTGRVFTVPPGVPGQQCDPTPIDNTAQTNYVQTVPQRIFVCTDDANYRTAPLTVEGYLLKRDCSTIRDYRIYFWQSNSLGIYSPDCRGYVFTDANGAFQITTVRPGTRIHFLVRYNNQDWYYSAYPDNIGITQFVNDRSTPTRLMSFNIVINV